MKNKLIDIVEQAAEKAGGIKALASKIGITHNALYSWRRVPAERVNVIATITGVPLHEIRPDVFKAPESVE